MQTTRDFLLFFTAVSHGKEKEREIIKLLGESLALQSFVCLSGKSTQLSHFAFPGLPWLVGAQA